MAIAPAVVVVGYDGSQSSEAALRIGVREARFRRARLLVVCAWHAPYHYYGSMAAPSAVRRLGEELRKEASARLEQAVATLRQEATDLTIESRLVEGPAASVLTNESGGAELLVVGSRGLGGFGKLLLGSVSHQCALNASCPVLIVPARASTEPRSAT